MVRLQQTRKLTKRPNSSRVAQLRRSHPCPPALWARLQRRATWSQPDGSEGYPRAGPRGNSPTETCSASAARDLTSWFVFQKTMALTPHSFRQGSDSSKKSSTKIRTTEISLAIEKLHDPYVPVILEAADDPATSKRVSCLGTHADACALVTEAPRQWYLKCLADNTKRIFGEGEYLASAIRENLHHDRPINPQLRVPNLLEQ